MPHKALGVALVLTLQFFSAQLASATSCGRPDSTVEHIIMSDAILVGRVVSSSYGVRPTSCIAGLFSVLLGDGPSDSDCVPCVLRFQVQERIKGVHTDEVSVDLNWATHCRFGPDLDMELLVFATKVDGQHLAINLCDGMLPASLEQVTELRTRLGGTAPPDR